MIRVIPDTATTRITGDTEEEIEFVDSWIHGVLSVEDSGAITVTSEVVGDLVKAAREQGLYSGPYGVVE